MAHKVAIVLGFAALTLTAAGLVALRFDPWNKEPLNVLLLGIDDPDRVEATGRSDAMVVVQVNPKTNEVKALHIPRDLRSCIPGVGPAKVNANWTWGGQRAMVYELSHALGIPIHRYAVLDMPGFVKAIDRIGGVDVDVKDAMDYEAQNVTIHIKPGRQTLDGNACLGWVRFRGGGRALTRTARGAEFLSALRAELTKPGKIARLPVFVNDVYSNINTDLTVQDAVSILHAALTVPADHARQYVLPTADAEVVRNDWFEVPLPKQDQAICSQFSLTVDAPPAPPYAALAPAMLWGTDGAYWTSLMPDRVSFRGAQGGRLQGWVVEVPGNGAVGRLSWPLRAGALPGAKLADLRVPISATNLGTSPVGVTVELQTDAGTALVSEQIVPAARKWETHELSVSWKSPLCKGPDQTGDIRRISVVTRSARPGVLAVILPTDNGPLPGTRITPVPIADLQSSSSVEDMQATARILFALGDVAGATATLRRVSQLDTEPRAAAEALIGLYQARIANGAETDLSTAAVLRRISHAQTPDAAGYFALEGARPLLQSGQYDGAAGVLRAAVALSPAPGLTASLLEELGSALLLSGKMDDGLATWRRATCTWPDPAQRWHSVQAHTQALRALHKTKLSALAAGSFAAMGFPALADYLQAVDAYNEDDLPRLQQAAAKAMADHRGTWEAAEASVLLGGELRRSGDLAGAGKMVHDALASSSDPLSSARLRVELGNIQLAAHQEQAAAEAYQSVLAQSGLCTDSIVRASLRLAELYAGRKDAEGCGRYLRPVLNICEWSPESRLLVYTSVGRCSERLGEPARGLVAYQAALEQLPRRIWCYDQETASAHLGTARCLAAALTPGDARIYLTDLLTALPPGQYPAFRQMAQDELDRLH